MYKIRGNISTADRGGGRSAIAPAIIVATRAGAGFTRGTIQRIAMERKPAVRPCRQCGSQLPLPGARGGRPRSVCVSSLCRARDAKRRRDVRVVRGYLRCAIQHGNEEAAARWRTRLAELG